MKQHYMVIDVSLCHDCNNCFMACKDEHVGNKWLPYTDEQPRHGHRWINIHSKERGQCPRIDVSYLPMPCQHCQDAPCMKANPDCIFRRDDGIVLIDSEKAKGKKELVESCPYGAIYWNEEANVGQKCTMCAHLMDSNEEFKVSRCAHSCPTGSIEYYTMEPDEMESMIKKENLEIYKPEFESHPHVFYKNLHRFTKNFVSACILVNGECFEGATVKLSNKTTGMNASSTTDGFGEFKFDKLDNGDYTLEITAGGLNYSSEIKIEDKSLNLGSIEM